MAARPWQVWQARAGESTALVVDEGTEGAMIRSAGQRNTAAARHMPDLVFLALPPGQEPAPADVRAVLGNRAGDRAAAAARHAAAVAAGWRPVMMELVELDERGALGGILAIIAARLDQVHRGWTPASDRAEHPPGALAGMAQQVAAGTGRSTMPPGTRAASYASAGALLAAEIDRAAAP